MKCLKSDVASNWFLRYVGTSWDNSITVLMAQFSCIWMKKWIDCTSQMVGKLNKV